MTALGLVRTRAAALLWLALALLVLAPATAAATERARLEVSQQSGFARLVLSFPDRLDLPAYRLHSDNGVLAVEFDDDIDLALPDVAVAVPDFVTVARIDPDRKGLRVGLRTDLQINPITAGEQLFIDLLPSNWQGLKPGLPQRVIDGLANRAKEAEALAARQARIEQAKRLKPSATVRVGRNPTFLRLEVDWNVPAEGHFTTDEGRARLDFDWPVPIDLFVLKAALPPEILSADASATDEGSSIALGLAEGVVPRFYQTSDTQFILDIDTSPPSGQGADTTLADLAKLAPAATSQPAQSAATNPDAGAAPVLDQTEITPTIATIGDTVRITFPFERDTAAALFRRGNTVWMLFDTPVVIHAPPADPQLSAIAAGLTVVPAGDTQVVRLDLAVDRLPTLGTEGRSWVVSLGDVLLSPGEPLPLARRRNQVGEYEMTADLERPGAMHQFRDPVVGDMLTVITAFAPARGLPRTLSYVDFTALASIQGLVLRPEREGLDIDIVDGRDALITTPGGLSLSALEQARIADSGLSDTQRSTYLDLSGPHEADPGKFFADREALIGKAAAAEGPARDAARLNLAHFYLANQFAQEAIGVSEVLIADTSSDDMRKPARLALAIADTLAHRPQDAMEILTSPSFVDEADATMWRAIARADMDDFIGARADALAAENVVASYPRWVREDFLFAAVRAALETNDFALAQRFLGRIDFAKLDPQDSSWFQLFTARIAEANSHFDEALDGYGQVIAADLRPKRAEAVYRTLVLLDKQGRLDIHKATKTLSAEVLLWRGDRLEQQMQKLLAELYFRERDYRLGFETVKEAVEYFPDNPSSDDLAFQAQSVFGELYLDGGADALPPVDALSLYYDFRELTPPGPRGDEMIRNLAGRLVKVDLLSQAGDLLEYQVDSRLAGAARAQVAADLAVIRIADRDPEAALRALNHTRLADLPPALERRRRILEARALIDADRQDLALDLLRSTEGRDADMLRIDGMWKSKQYQSAAELIEAFYAPASGESLNPVARMNIVKAGVGFVLASDQLGLSRLRSKYAERMARTPEWPLFDFVTGPIISTTNADFRKVAREVSGLDSLDAFLATYRQIYGGADAPTPDKASPAEQG
jgi:hypothetical protein